MAYCIYGLWAPNCLATLCYSIVPPLYLLKGIPLFPSVRLFLFISSKVFPVIHGRFGEDGGIQELLEKANIPFVGTPSDECRRAFDKFEASVELKKQGFVTVPSVLVQGSASNKSEISNWFSTNQIDSNVGKVVVKPARAGSSIGVTVAYGVDDSIRKANAIISEGIDDRVVIEVFLHGGSEFTAIVLDTGSGFDFQPVVLLPTEEMEKRMDSSLFF